MEMHDQYARHRESFGEQPSLHDPDWAKHVVWYEIMLDRFCNADPANDPARGDLCGAYPGDPPLDWRITPFTHPWPVLQPHERGLIDIHTRRFGGDLQGLLNKLDDLEDLGINALYLTPIFDAPSMHKYDARGYQHVDPNFGPDPRYDRELISREDPADSATWQWTSADLLMLDVIAEVHRRGMYIILDGVFNHIGHTSPFFQDVLRRGEASPYWSWFTLERDGSGTLIPKCWCGDRTLPEWARNADGIVEGPMRYIEACTAR